MLRNSSLRYTALMFDAVLNEVLSLNAQEWLESGLSYAWTCFLNEVLSLNAQECRCGASARPIC